MFETDSMFVCRKGISDGVHKVFRTGDTKFTGDCKLFLGYIYLQESYVAQILTQPSNINLLVY